MKKGLPYLYESQVQKMTFTFDPAIIEWVRTKGKRNKSKFVNKILEEAMEIEQSKEQIDTRTETA